MKIKFTLVLAILFFQLKNHAQTYNAAPYCTPQYFSTCTQPGPSNAPGNFVNDFINSFMTIGGNMNISNLNTGCLSPAGYNNYCNHFLATMPGQVITCSLQTGLFYNQGIAIFIDWNQDNTFAVPSEMVASTPSTIVGGSWVSLTFTVPPAQAFGSYRMRARCARLTFGGSINPCSNVQYGEAEDYNVYVGIPAPGPITVTANPTLVCVGSSSSLTATGVGSYTWSTGATGSLAVISPTAGEIYYVAAPSNSCMAVSAVSINVAPTPTVQANSSSTVICSGSSATLSATGANNYTWTPGGNGASITISPTVNTTYTVAGSDGTCVATSTITQLVTVCIGLKIQQSGSAGVSVFPSPFKDELTVKTNSTVEIKLLNSLGQIVFQKTINTDEVINTEFLSKGIYYISYNENGNRKTIKVLKN